MPVDQYIGGVEHAILHLLYSRFFMKAISAMKIKILNLKNHLKDLFTQGMVCHETYKDKNNNWISPDEIETINGKKILKKIPSIGGKDWCIRINVKSKKNTVDPERIIENLWCRCSKIIYFIR